MTDLDNAKGIEPTSSGVFRGTATIGGRGLFRPLRGFAAEWKGLLVGYFAIFGALWTIIAAVSYLLSANLSGLPVFVLIVCLSAIVTLGRTLHRLWHAVPAGFENESKEAQRLAHLRPPLWEYRLARSLLDSKIATIDVDLDNLLQGRTFVKLESRPMFSEYVRWLQLRPNNLIKMIGVAEQLILVDLPAAAFSTAGKPASPEAILRTVSLIEKLYREAYQFELEGHTVVPPTQLVAIHHIQQGWVISIGGGIQQLLGFFDRMATLDPKKSHKVEYEIVFKEPAGMAEFSRELEKIERLRPDDILGMELA